MVPLYTGTREELIERLENSYINYEDLSSSQITEMLKDRHVRRKDSHWADRTERQIREICEKSDALR
jgi:hypothetical protein